MKKQLVLIMALLGSLFTFAQKGEIIYTDFEPDSTVHFWASWQPQTPDLYLDIDHDGINDWHFYRIIGQLGTRAVRFRHIDYDENTPFLIWFNLPFGSDISELAWEPNGIPHDSDFVYNYVPSFPNGPHSQQHYPPHYLALRHKVGEEVYYGWIEASVEFNDDGTESDVTVYRMAYCTIPDYPFCVGQTDFTTWSVEESEATAFATVHPNPAKSTFTITGTNLKQAEVLNTLGQRVATAKSEDNQMTVDISGLSAGVYFVNITNEEGRKCVRKVVKE